MTHVIAILFVAAGCVAWGLLRLQGGQNGCDGCETACPVERGRDAE